MPQNQYNLKLKPLKKYYQNNTQNNMNLLLDYERFCKLSANWVRFWNRSLVCVIINSKGKEWEILQGIYFLFALYTTQILLFLL